MLPAGYTAVLDAASREDFLGEVVRFTQHIGFSTVSAMTVTDLGRGQSEFTSVDNAPPGFAQVYHDVQNMRRDPVMQHCRRHAFPIIWDQSTYTHCGLGEMWEEQARFGYRTGIAMALHLPDGRHFALGVERDQPLPVGSPALQRMVADLQLFVMHAQAAALRVLVPGPAGVRLTPREREALRWTREGKTAWEVGRILGISERTAVLHVTNAMHKLGCTSKYQAVLEAMRLGLLGDSD